MKLDPDITVRDGKRTESPNKSIVQVRPRQTFGYDRTDQTEYLISSDNPNGFVRTDGQRVVRWSLLSLYQGNEIRMEGLNIRNSKCHSKHNSMNKVNVLGQKNYLLKLHYIGQQISRLTLLLKQGYKIKFRFQHQNNQFFIMLCSMSTAHGIGLKRIPEVEIGTVSRFLSVSGDQLHAILNLGYLDQNG